MSAATPAGQRPSIDGGLWEWTTEDRLPRHVLGLGGVSLVVPIHVRTPTVLLVWRL